jgi:Tfp pilus assembly protein PilZ
VGETDKIALSKNLSETGLNLNTNQLFEPGASIQVELKFPDRTFNMWARVVWIKKVPRQQALTFKAWMGLSFIAPSPEWREYFGEWSKGRPGT